MHLKKGAPRYYCYSVVTLVHKGCGRASEFQPEVFANTPHRGRVLTVRIEPEDQLPFLATNVYNYTSRETDSQRELLGMLAARMDAGEISPPPAPPQTPHDSLCKMENTTPLCIPTHLSDIRADM